jgi:DNA-binding winged helix-turn-helix (wHTH) protein/Tol biopolymer transport system component
VKGDFRLSGYLVQPSLNAIVGAASTARVEPKAMQVLVYLAEHAGEVVLKEDLIRAVWSETFVTDDVLVHAISDLRRALEDDSRQPQVIQTVPKSGYRLIPSVQPADSQRVAGGNGGPAQLGQASVPLPVPALQPRSRRLWVGLGAVLLVAGVFSFGVFVGRGRVAAELQPSFQRLTFRRGEIYSARFLPDGRTIVYTAEWTDAPLEIYSARPEFPESQALNQGAALLLAISPTGGMAVARDPQLFVGLNHWSSGLAEVPLVGGEPRDILSHVVSADYGPDGKTLAVAHLVNGESLLEYPIGNVVFRTSGWLSNLRVSPDGTRVAFLNHTMQVDDRGDVAAVDRAGHLQTLSAGWESEQGLAWSPRGDEIWFTATTSGLDRNLYGVTLSGKLRMVHSIAGGWRLQDVFRDGRVLLTHTNQRLEAWGATSRRFPPRDLSWLEASYPEDLSSDGQTMLFTEQGLAAGPNYLVGLRKLDGSRPVRLGEGRGLALSPDGKWVISTIASKDGERLMLLPTGAGDTRTLASGPSHHIFARWLPGGERFAFIGTQQGRPPALYIQDVHGGPPRKLTEAPTEFFAVSPDGKKIAVGSLQSNGLVFPVDGGDPVPVSWLAPQELPIRWTSDGSSVYTQKWTQKSTVVYKTNLATGKKAVWIEFPSESPIGGRISCVGLSDDGERYTYTLERSMSDLYLATGLK